MSRKLQSQIQDIKGLPGRFKRVLLAWASFANNDGTNIFPAKETVGERAGVSRWTIYDHSDILEAADVLQRATSHMCRNERCNKGGTHWTSQHGHYTTVHRINVALLGNPTLLLQKIKEATVAKSNSSTVGKTQRGTVGEPDTTQALEETPAPLGNPNSSALASGVGLLVSSVDSLRSSTPNAPPASPSSLVDCGGESSLRSERQNPRSEPEEEREQPNIDPWTLLPVDPGLKPWNGFNGDPDPDAEEDREKTLCFWSVVRKSDIAWCLGIEKFDERHFKELSVIVDVLCARNRSAEWLAGLVRWAKQHKFWSKRLHAGDRAVAQLVKHLEKGDICEQFDSALAVTFGEEAFTGRYGSLYTLDRENGGLAAALAKKFAKKYGTGGGSYFLRDDPRV